MKILQYHYIQNGEKTQISLQVNDFTKIPHIIDLRIVLYNFNWRGSTNFKKRIP